MYNSPYQSQRFNGRQFVEPMNTFQQGPVVPQINNRPGGNRPFQGGANSGNANPFGPPQGGGFVADTAPPETGNTGYSNSSGFGGMHTNKPAYTGPYINPNVDANGNPIAGNRPQGNSANFHSGGYIPPPAPVANYNLGPFMGGSNLNQPGGMTTTVEEINAGNVKPELDSQTGGGGASLPASPSLGPNAPGGMGQPAMPQFSRFGGANRQPGMLAPSQDFMRNQMEMRRRLRAGQTGTSAEAPKPFGGNIDPVDPYVGA